MESYVMRARGLSGEGDSACDAGNSGRVGSAPHAASNAHASSANAVPGQVRVSATLRLLAQPRSPSKRSGPCLSKRSPEDVSEPLNVRSSRAESRVAGHREDVRSRRHRINRPMIVSLSGHRPESRASQRSWPKRPVIFSAGLPHFPSGRIIRRRDITGSVASRGPRCANPRPPGS